MKFFFLFTLLLFNQCVVFDTIGLTYPTSVSGKEAKDIIISKAVLGSLACGGSNCSGNSPVGYFADRLAFIEEDAYYDKTDVEECADGAFQINLLTVDIGGFQCNLVKHKRFVNWPIELF